MSIYNHFRGGFIQRILQSQPKWRYLHFMPSTHSFYRPFLLFSAVLCLFSSIHAQQFEPMRGGNAPMRGDDGGLEPTIEGASELRRVDSVSNCNSMIKISILQARPVQSSRFGFPTIRHRSEKLLDFYPTVE